ncbi:MAG TPA: YtxH domain-containing protein [Ktedonobacteraceae bacterium]|nr:YtxH domain-containing protein [Ktedonobacteraceae bacterium]
MNSFVKGVLVGVGVGLLVAPMRGEEMRNVLSQRLEQMRGYLPENEQMNQYMQQVSTRVSQASSNLSDLAQQAADKVKDTSSSLGNLAQQATSTVKQTGSDVATTTKQAATTAKQNVQSSTASTTNTPKSYGSYNS